MYRIAIAAVCVLLVACASTEASKATAAEEPVYRTGSNIPVRDTDQPTPGTKKLDSTMTQMGRQVPSAAPRVGP